MRYTSILLSIPFILVACAGGNAPETEPQVQSVEIVEQAAPEQDATAELPQPTILVTPAHNGNGIPEFQVVQNNPFARALMESINEYLTKKKYDVKSLEGQADLDNLVQMQNDIAETDEDLSYLASLSLGADVYIKFAGNAKMKSITVELNAYESSTARLLGSETIQDPDCGASDQTTIKTCLHDAAKRGMPLLEKKILAYWQQDLNQGTQYKIVMNLKGDFDEEQIEDLHDDIASGLKKSFKRVNVNVMTAKAIDMIVYADPAEFPDSQSVYSFIRNMLKGKADTKKVNVTRKFILMDVE
ncbi:DUF6175 family protein [uncultured Fibrobacter sp.]|uniref:DUF6175 family protein n=1 Tax=uncultured Fibrobacter sp. TaxID=261512 RepID=UPI0025F3A311|nr:DUF6175 family protein [uncultured Fibrobacter sp.]